MARRIKKLYPALKHGAYSASGLLPGEDPVAFEELHQNLIAFYEPNGPLQESTILDVARTMWRKENLQTFRIAEAARKRHSVIRAQMIPSATPVLQPLEYLRDDWIPPTAAEIEAATEAAEARARQELGENYKFVELGDLATPAQLLAELEVEERLDARIDKLLKRYAISKTFESLNSRSSTELPRIPGPKKAA
jgi:hypothetical protein